MISGEYYSKYAPLISTFPQHNELAYQNMLVDCLVGKCFLLQMIFHYERKGMMGKKSNYLEKTPTANPVNKCHRSLSLSCDEF